MNDVETDNKSIDFSDISSNDNNSFVDTSLFRNYGKTSLTDVDGTYINYHVVQLSDNDYYLTHSFLKEDKNSGLIFMNYGNFFDMSNQNTIFYGYNLLNDTVFGSLDMLFQDNLVITSNHKIVILTSTK